jgi:hypothetical protein
MWGLDTTWFQRTVTSERSTNQDCADTKLCTFLLMARGLRS